MTKSLLIICTTLLLGVCNTLADEVGFDGCNYQYEIGADATYITAIRCPKTNVNSAEFDNGFDLGVKCMSLLALGLSFTNQRKTFEEMEKLCRKRFKIRQPHE